MNKKKLKRREEREELFKILFQREIQGCSFQEAYESSLLFENIQAQKNSKLFIESYLEGIQKKESFLEESIQAVMTDWDFFRIAYVERSLLKLASYEIYFEDLPIEIIVNEAVELAKIYGDMKSHEFINGVLAKLIRNKK